MRVALRGGEHLRVTGSSPRVNPLFPNCGFAPDAGEPTTIDEAYEKLTRLVAAKRVRDHVGVPASAG
jgi:hypothetical protein